LTELKGVVGVPVVPTNEYCKNPVAPGTRTLCKLE
jgi:hypothetical protein